MFDRWLPSFTCLLLLVALVPDADGQTVWSDSFESVGTPGLNGPSNMLANGYVFRTVVAGPAAPQPWGPGPLPGQLTPHDGVANLRTGLSIPAFADGSIASWMILPPEVTGAGRELSLWVSGFTSTTNFAGSVQLRYSPSGGTATGVGVADVGDFTVQLDGNLPGSFSAWDQLLGSLPGSGRAAVRWIGTYSGGFSGSSMNLLLDDARLVSGSVAPPLPQAGQTVHWTPALSPIHLTAQQYIPAGGTLIVDPGVLISIDFETSTFGGPEIWCDGELILAGTQAQPVTVVAGAGLSRLPLVSSGQVGGSLTLEHAHVGVRVGGRAVRADHTQFSRPSPVNWSSSTDTQQYTPGVYCGTYSYVGATARLQNCTFVNAAAELMECFGVVEGCVFDDARLTLGRYFPTSDVLLRGNVFRNLTETAPLVVDGVNVAVESSNSFVNNRYPVQLSGGGLVPGSVVPVSGNLDNRVVMRGGSQVFLGRITVPRLAVPYYVPFGGDLDQRYAEVTLLPGARLQLGGGAFLGALGGNQLRFRGEPGAPVRVEAADLLEPWITLRWGANATPQFLDHVHVSGGTYGVGAADTLVMVRNGEFTGNTEAVRAGEFGRVVLSKNHLHSNQIGFHAIVGGQGTAATGVVLADGGAMPNLIVNNAQGAVVDPPQGNTSLARGNWWGHPNGPQGPQTPTGGGNSVSAGVQVLPFLTTPPSLLDTPPVVRALPSGRAKVVRAGDKVILSWKASDDGRIVSQRLERIPIGGYDIYTPQLLVGNIPADARSVELVVPDWNSVGDPYPYVRIVATDDQGQEGFDEFHWVQDYPGSVNPAWITDLSGGFTIGSSFLLDWAGYDSATLNVTLFLDDQCWWWSRGSTIGALLPGSNTMPAVSTDLARYGLEFQGHWTLSPYFAIRPDACIGNAPPAVQVQHPASGAALAAGQVVPLRWTASDDTALRSFEVQVSCNAGWTWFPVVADLHPATRAYDWRLPASTGIADLRLRVIANDEHFQTSSSSTGPLVVAAGTWGNSDCNANGTPDSEDIERGLSLDTNHDGVPDECALAPTLYCLGDGTGAACPCGNVSASSAAAGCLNSLGVGGALRANGVAGVYGDSLVLRASALPNSTALFFQGTTRTQGGAGLVFGDGLRCASGTLVRLATKSAVNGQVSYPAGNEQGIAARGHVSLPGTRTYQVWYRNAANYCSASTFNLTNGVMVSWQL